MLQEMDCVIIDWANQSYLLPVKLLVSAHVFETRKFVDKSEQFKSHAIGMYLWQGKQIPIYTLNLKKISMSEAVDLKLVVLHAPKASNPYQSDHIAVLFEHEAKIIIVHPSELTWDDPKLFRAKLQQRHLDATVVLFQSNQYT